MLDIRYIRENKALVEQIAQYKRASVDIDALLALDDSRKDMLARVEQLKSVRNATNEEITRLKKDGKDFQQNIDAMKQVSQQIKEWDAKIAPIEEKIQAMMILIPNVVHESVPRSADASANRVIKEWGEKKAFPFQPKDHLDLAENLGWLDMKRAGKITGSGFALYRGQGALLERALINFMLNLHIKKHGYTEIIPPFVVNRASMFGTGQLPKLEEDMYRIQEDDLFLIPTAEVPVTNIHRDEIFTEQELPRYYVSYTPCFRREAGTYGKDTRGISRVHQFNKVELVKFSSPETSYEEHEKLLKDAEEILQVLGIPYRVLLLSAGDMSFSAAKCYDIEIWAPGSNRWFEVSSCSNFEDFQARRANIRYRPKGVPKVRFVHTLNASGLALPRTVIAVLENYQNADGTISFPAALKPYIDI